MNYKEFVQQAMLNGLPVLIEARDVTDSSLLSLVKISKEAADRLVEEGLLDPPASEKPAIQKTGTGEYIVDFTQAIEVPRKSCDKACGPSDYEPGGMCDRNGCYKPKPDEITWLDVVKGKSFRGDYLYKVIDVKGGIVYWYSPDSASGYAPMNEFIRNMNAVGAREVKA